MVYTGAANLSHTAFWMRTRRAGGKRPQRRTPLRHAAATSPLAARLALMSLTAALMASSASMEQCSFTGGRARCLAMSEFLMVTTSSSVRPLTHSVATDDDAMADPHPNVLKHESTMLPSSST